MISVGGCSSALASRPFALLLSSRRQILFNTQTQHTPATLPAPLCPGCCADVHNSLSRSRSNVNFLLTVPARPFLIRPLRMRQAGCRHILLGVQQFLQLRLGVCRAEPPARLAQEGEPAVRAAVCRPGERLPSARADGVTATGAGATSGCGELGMCGWRTAAIAAVFSDAQ
jgi:hypothetical protein